MTRIIAKITFLQIVFFAIMGCSTSPEITLKVRKEAELIFDIRSRGINGLLSAKLWQCDSKELLWDVNLNYFNGAHLVYGIPPVRFKTSNGATTDAQQRIPPAGVRPKPLPANHRFWLRLECQYDTPMSASVRVTYFLIDTGPGDKAPTIQSLASKPEDLSL